MNIQLCRSLGQLYLGLAIAYGWDTDWNFISEAAYQSFYGEQGFDDMDEHIVRDLLGIPLDSEEAQNLESMIRRSAQTAVTLIRAEQIEPQSPMALLCFCTRREGSIPHRSCH